MNMPRLFLETALSERDVKAVSDYVQRMVEYFTDMPAPDIGMASAPTPEVEPVYQSFCEGSWDDVTKERYDWAMSRGMKYYRKLYAHPAPSDELVKAVEEYINYIGHYSRTDAEQTLLANLRAALDKVKS